MVLAKAALAGGLASSVSVLTLHPVDTLKTRLQTTAGATLGTMARSAPAIGIRGLYRGIIPAVGGGHTLRSDSFLLLSLHCYRDLPTGSVWVFERCSGGGSGVCVPACVCVHKRVCVRVHVCVCVSLGLVCECAHAYSSGGMLLCPTAAPGVSLINDLHVHLQAGQLQCLLLFLASLT